jgi:hypothetical protein
VDERLTIYANYGFIRKIQAMFDYLNNYSPRELAEITKSNNAIYRARWSSEDPIPLNANKESKPKLTKLQRNLNIAQACGFLL